MITDLENLLNDDQFRDLVKAINENKDFKLAKDGLNIESKATDNSFQIHISYDDTANKEADNFKKFINSIDDDLFIEVCEKLGTKKLNEIQKALNSNDLKSLRVNIEFFKNTLETIIKSKINYYKECLTRLRK